MESFKLPPCRLNASGEERKAGFEFEFTGVEMGNIADILQSIYGGEIKQVSTYEYTVTDTEFGTFKLELDAQLLRDKKYEKLLKEFGIDLSRFKNIKAIESKLKSVASSVVPFEIVTPPIPVSNLNSLNLLVEELRDWRAKGTGSSVFYAFGMHINPEIPNGSVNSLLAHLRAFLLLDQWIREDAEINISRKITPFINEYKKDYVELILSGSYEPSLREFIDDYFTFENTRNRPLDLLPVFMHLEPDYTSDKLKETLTTGRPTYHYRLPNCSIEEENWSIANEWNRWVLVEILASNKKTLNQYARAYLKIKKETLVGFDSKWVELMNRWVKNVT